MFGDQGDFVIHGVTKSGVRFRPSDWAERLCGIMAEFGIDGRLRYSRYLKPVSIGSAKSVAVSGRLKGHNTVAYEYLLRFARDNDLQVTTGPIAFIFQKDRQRRQAGVPPHRQTDVLVA